MASAEMHSTPMGPSRIEPKHPPRPKTPEATPRVEGASDKEIMEAWEHSAIPLVSAAMDRGEFQTADKTKLKDEEVAWREKVQQAVTDQNIIRGESKPPGRYKVEEIKNDGESVGHYRIIDTAQPNDKGREVWIQQTVEPIVQALERIGEDKVQTPDGQQVPSRRALNAKDHADTFRSLMKKDPELKNGYYFSEDEPPERAKPQPETKPVKELKDAKEARENAMAAAGKIITDRFGEIANMSDEQLNNFIENIKEPHLKEMVFFYGRMLKNKGNKDLLSALLTHSVRGYVNQHNKPEEQSALMGAKTMLSENEAYYLKKGDPVTEKLRHRLITDNGLEPEKADEMLKKCDPAKIYMFTANLFPAIDADLGADPHTPGKQYVQKVIEHAQGYLSPDETYLLSHLYNGGHGLNAMKDLSLGSIDDLGLTELYDKGFVKGLASKIPFMRGPEDMRSLMLNDLDEIIKHLKIPLPKDGYKKIRKAIAMEDNEIAKFSKAFDGSVIMWLMLAIQLVQGVLNEGVEEGGGKRGQPG